jgi:hypothetical protein
MLGGGDGFGLAGVVRRNGISVALRVPCCVLDFRCRNTLVVCVECGGRTIGEKIPMTSKTLLTIGVLWLGAASLSMLLRFPYEVLFVGFGRGYIAKLAAFISALLLGIGSTVFYLGWIVPLGLGAYRIVKKH